MEGCNEKLTKDKEKEERQRGLELAGDRGEYNKEVEEE